MNWRTAFRRLGIGCLATVFVGAAGAAQQNPAQKQLVGSWKLVVATTTRPDGTRFYGAGENATGLLMFDDSGSFSWTIIRPDIPKFVSNNRLEGTPEEF